MPRDRNTGIVIRYSFYIKAIHVDFDSKWRPGSTVSLVQRRWDREELLYRKGNCPKRLRWVSYQPTMFPYSHIIIMKSAEGWEDSGIVMALPQAVEMAERGIYDRQGEAQIKVKQSFWAGTSTIQLRVRRWQAYNCAELNDGLEDRHVDSQQKEDEDPVINSIIQTIIPLSFDFSLAQMHALNRGLSCSQFEEEYSEPETKLIRHQSSIRSQIRPCYLMLHLHVASAFDIELKSFTPRKIRSFITTFDWSATSVPPAFLSRSDSFRSLNNLHLRFPPQDHNHCPSAPCRQGDLTITISAHEISFLDGTNSVSSGNSFSINTVHRIVNINYINNIGDVFLAPINGGNVGGRHNHNVVRPRSPIGSCSPRAPQTQVVSGR